MHNETILGTAIGTSRMLEVKPGWHKGSRLFTTVVADPGSKKSPALALAMQPLRERQQRHPVAGITRASQAETLVRDLIDLGAGELRERRLPSGRSQKVVVVRAHES